LESAAAVAVALCVVHQLLYITYQFHNHHHHQHHQHQLNESLSHSHRKKKVWRARSVLVSKIGPHHAPCSTRNELTSIFRSDLLLKDSLGVEFSRRVTQKYLRKEFEQENVFELQLRKEQKHQQKPFIMENKRSCTRKRQTAASARNV
jgi:hypothetical protein